MCFSPEPTQDSTEASVDSFGALGDSDIKEGETWLLFLGRKVSFFWIACSNRVVEFTMASFSLGLSFAESTDLHEGDPLLPSTSFQVS